MEHYCLGFLFDKHDRVALVKKTRGPVELHGKWNGIGGAKEEGEYWGMMTREFEEETGIFISHWLYFGEFKVEDACIHLFTKKVNEVLRLPKTNDVGEKLDWFSNHDLLHEIMPDNLEWLLPMAKHRLDNNLNAVIRQ